MDQSRKAVPVEVDVDLASEIQRRCELRGDFELRSGRRTTQYFDKYQFESDPVLLRAVAKAMVTIVPPRVEILAGLELGGIALAVSLSSLTGLPTTFVRKHAKPYGTARLAEGASVDGRRALVVEDVVTSGGQIVASTRDLRNLGAIVEHAVCVIDRQEGGEENVRAATVELHPLFTAHDLMAATETSTGLGHATTFG